MNLPAFVTDGYRIYQTAEASTTRMRTLDAQRIERRSNLRQLMQRLAEIENDVKLEIYLATNGGGKPAYGNEAARTEAVKKALRESPEAQRFVRDISECETAIARIEAEHDEARRQRSNCLALLEYASAWLRLAASDETQEQD